MAEWLSMIGWLIFLFFLGWFLAAVAFVLLIAEKSKRHCNHGTANGYYCGRCDENNVSHKARHSTL